MRLGFHYHIPAEMRNGRIYTLSLQGLFIDNLAPFCERMILFLYKPLKAEVETLDYAIQSDNVELVSLVKHYSIPVRLLLQHSIRKKIRQRVNDMDILLMRAPTPLLPLIAQDVKGKIAFAYLVVGEMSDHIDNIPQAWWRRGMLKKYILWNEERQRQFAPDALVFANSAVVFEKYKAMAKKAALVYTTTLQKKDFFFKEDTCQQRPIEILFSGRIERGKGILEITEAIGKLIWEEKLDCRLNIVGWAEPKDPTPDMIKELAAKWKVSDKVIFHGKKSVGEELFSFYQKADIFILASQVAEGFPRTIWEALANSVPIISTAVGSIPIFLKDRSEVLLVEQRNAADIVKKVKILVEDAELRKRMIKNGLRRVDEVTLEVQAKKIADTMEDYLRSLKS